MKRLLEFILGCRHRRETFPIKRRNRKGELLVSLPSYVACIECGRERDHTLLDVGPVQTCAASGHAWEVA